MNEAEIERVKTQAVKEFLLSEAEATTKSMELARELLPLLTRESAVITNKALQIARISCGRPLTFG